MTFWLLLDKNIKIKLKLKKKMAKKIKYQSKNSPFHTIPN